MTADPYYEISCGGATSRVSYEQARERIREGGSGPLRVTVRRVQELAGGGRESTVVWDSEWAGEQIILAGGGPRERLSGLAERAGCPA